jgi:hypothetical protein
MYRKMWTNTEANTGASNAYAHCYRNAKSYSHAPTHSAAPLDAAAAALALR